MPALVYVLDGNLRLVLATHDAVLATGEAAELDTCGTTLAPPRKALPIRTQGRGGFSTRRWGTEQPTASTSSKLQLYRAIQRPCGWSRAKDGPPIASAVSAQIGTAEA